MPGFFILYRFLACSQLTRTLELVSWIPHPWLPQCPIVVASVLTGVDIDDKDAIDKHYRLLAAIMRVICAAVLSRGSQNEQSLEQGRKFLSKRFATLDRFDRS